MDEESSFLLNVLTIPVYNLFQISSNAFIASSIKPRTAVGKSSIKNLPIASPKPVIAFPISLCPD